MWEPLRVEVQGKSIVVTMPGTSFAVTYEIDAGNRTLVLTRTWLGPSTTSPIIAQFRTRAYQAAVDRARELGWIV
jgi:hypothetical protein